MELTDLTISQIHKGFIGKDFSALDLTDAYLKRIEKLNKKIFAFLSVFPNEARLQAKRADETINSTKNFPLLTGIPIAIKDNILIEGQKCTSASKILENYIAPYNATVIEKLSRQGAVFLGKTNLDEFAMGSSTENSAFGPTRNPLDEERVPGGSSGGSAAAVAGELACCALGSDTGGSIRQPASFCGVVGLKPTYGEVSRYGLMATASSLDQIGPFAKNVEDAKIVFKEIVGKDPLDSTSIDYKFIDSDFDIKNLKIGIPKEYFIKGIDKDVEKVIKEAINKIEKAGAKIEEISLPNTEYGLAAYYIIMPSEVSANMARYDGIRFGRTPEIKKESDLFSYYLSSREQGFGEEVRRRIMLGVYTLSAGYYDAYYLKAQKVRTLIREDFNKAFKKVDIILTPVSPTLPFKLGEKIKDPLEMYLSDIFTVSINLAGLPAMSIPAGQVGKLSVGLQIIGKPFDEKTIFNAGQKFQELL
ncbi:MAG: Asp-tRNA(Asn)/Glu-tRNA(Gln) amidotransferase subunit GatA [Candidatus Parcubacteria bacterium]|nr:Asp-tRNA(Asn)/Glu-tRNA(Gln) amidotransferase subunit GatA [Candidatus Parcubacteria bacterium]